MENCAYYPCDNEPIFLCTCAFSVCEAHCEQHIEEKGKHNVTKNYLKPSEGKSGLIGHCKKILRKIKKTKNQISNISKRGIERIIKISAEGFEKLREYESLIYEIIDNLQKNVKIARRENPQAQIIAKYYDDHKNLYEDLKMIKTDCIDILNFKEKAHNSDKELIQTLEHKNNQFILAMQKMQNLFAPLYDIADLLDESYNSTKLCFFDHQGSKVFHVIDAIENNDKKKTIETLKTAITYPAFCLLPDDKYFCYGGDTGFAIYSYSGFAYIIDIESQNVQFCRDYKSKGYIGPSCYRDKIVYTFGGYTVNSCEKYYLSDDNWSSISSLPSSYFYNSTTLVKNKILLCGYNQGSILHYDIETDKYETFQGTTANCFKLVFAGNKRIYILDGTKILESSCEKGRSFNQININQGTNQRCLSYCLRNKEHVYFVMEDYYLYAYSFIKRSIEKIRQVK